MEFPEQLPDKPQKSNSVPYWSEAEKARVRTLWISGFSANQIGKLVNRSRNAVMGAIHRMGLSRKPKAINETLRQQTRLRNARQRQRRYSERRAQARGVYAPPMGKRAVGSCDLAPETTPNPVNIMELKFHHCRWPVQGYGFTMLYCGGNRYGIGPYCHRHAKVSLGEQPVRLR